MRLSSAASVLGLGSLYKRETAIRPFRWTKKELQGGSLLNDDVDQFKDVDNRSAGGSTRTGIDICS